MWVRAFLLPMPHTRVSSGTPKCHIQNHCADPMAAITCLTFFKGCEEAYEPKWVPCAESNIKDTLTGYTAPSVEACNPRCDAATEDNKLPASGPAELPAPP